MQVTEFERFFKENYSKIYYLALSLVHDDEVARDIMADSFEYLFSHHADLQIDEACNFYPSHPSRSLFLIFNHLIMRWLSLLYGVIDSRNVYKIHHAIHHLLPLSITSFSLSSC